MKKELNFELLKSLYKVFSPSLREKKMRKFIKHYIRTNIPGVMVEQDSIGNLLITKGDSDTYPCICAHMDQVQDLHPKDFECIEYGDAIFGYSEKVRKQCGLGADDKNGLFIALECLASYDVLKCAFFVGEEIGCRGSRVVDMGFFSNCRFCIQIDRRGNSDMVTSIYGYMCSTEFLSSVKHEEYGYKESDGLMTDVAELFSRGVGISCINLSCGYYEPHTDHEFTSKSDVQKCYDFVCHIIETCSDTYECHRQDSLYAWSTSSWQMPLLRGSRKRKASQTDSYLKDYIRDEVKSILKWWDDATLPEVYDELSYNGYTDYISFDEIADIYEEVSEKLKQEA